MQWLAEICVRRPVFASVLILSLTVIGAFAFGQLGVDRLPQVDFPTVSITTRLPGAAPEQVESEVTDKIEEAVNTISGIDQLNSNSAEGISQVIVTFQLEKNADVAAQEVRDRINRILPLLPRTITQPTIEKQDPDAAPILTIAVTAQKPIRDVTEYTDKVLRRRLESADGVGQVLVLGGRKRQINIWVDAARLRSYNLTVNDVSRALQAQNADVPGGRIDQGPQSITMRTRGRVEKPEEFGSLVLRQVDGHPVQVADVARVDDGVADLTTLANINGDPTVLLQIRKQSGTNTVEVVNNVKERLQDIRQALPPGYELRIVRDQAEFIEASFRSVQEHLIVGSFLAAFLTAPVLLPLTDSRSWRLPLAIWGGLALVGLGVWIAALPTWRLREEPSLRPGQGSAAAGVAGWSPWRDRAAWRVALLFAGQGVAYYLLVAWLPSVYEGAGVEETTGGALFALFNVAAFPAMVGLPPLSDRLGSRRAASVLAGCFFLAGAFGQQFIVTAAFPRLVIFIAATLLHGAVFMGLYYVLDLRVFPSPWKPLAAQALGNALVGIVAFGIIEALPGIVSASLWEIDAAASRMPDTAETRLRQGRDATIDWAVIAEATGPEEAARAGERFGKADAGAAGAAVTPAPETYRLLCSLGPGAR